MSKTKILMVCLGNICRSPLAHGLLESKLDADQYFVDSAGTGNWHVGSPPDPRSVAIARRHGLDISRQRGQHFEAHHFEQFDHIFVMDSSNREHVLTLAPQPEQRSKVQLIMEEIFPGERMDVPDPYYGGDDGFERVFQMLDRATDEIAARI
ncbi:low molecular weight protein-tyrosine-phosphatase [Croceiramulus getboli]|nr:low molecular weight phosphotyrosine protein phosphatase [Flavobacteriaceae bacterium YJPT1-3]